MSRAHHRPANKALAVAQYVPMLADLLNPLAEEVGKAIAREVIDLSRRTTKTSKGASGARVTVYANSADELGTQISVLVTRLLERSLCSRTAQGKALRMALIAKLANEEVASSEAGATPAQASAAGSDVLLTTAEAAVKLEVSRPYVSMLCDAGKLGQVVMTEGGHRRIRSSAVAVYLNTRTKQHEAAMSPRAAGAAAGLYDYDEGHFVNVIRASGSPAQRPKRSPATKTARKPRS